MDIFLALLSILGLLVIIRMILGPTIWDRLLCFNELSTKIIIAITITGIITEQSFFLDIAIVYTLLSFMSTVLIARFLNNSSEN